MNILLLNGSPRTNGNTSALSQAFAEEARSNGHQISLQPIGRMDIRGCKNCDACRKTLTGNCIQKDDMQKVLPLMAECEMLVIASPIYYFSLAGQIHCAIERMYSFERLPKLQKAALFLTAGGSGFTLAIQTYQEAIIRHMRAEDMGIIKAVGSQAKTKEKQEEVRRIARSL